jgi:hypothetical protein
MYNFASRNVTRLESENKILKFKLENSAYSLQLIREEAYNYISEVARLRHEVYRISQNPGNPTTNFSRSIELPGDEALAMQLQAQLDAEHKRAEDISAWYKKEYEVLPAWYKKFGHVVKAFKGERTFKSLFK